MSERSPVWPASAADWPRLAEARGSLRRALALRGASGKPAGQMRSHLVSDVGVPVELVTHTVRLGESIASIALRYGMRRNDLVQSNRLLSPQVYRARLRVVVVIKPTTTGAAAI